MAWSRVAVGLEDVGEAVVLVEELEELEVLEELEALFCARLTAAQRMTENHNVVRIMSSVKYLLPQSEVILTGKGQEN